MKKSFVLSIVCFLVLSFVANGDPLEYHLPAMKAQNEGRWEDACRLLQMEVREYEQERQNHLNAKPDPIVGIVFDMYVSINHVQSCVELALVSCNCGDYETAVTSMGNAVNIINSEANLRANNSVERAAKILNKLRQSGLRMKFTSDELSRLTMFITEAPRANFYKSTQESINRSNAIGAYFDSRKKTYQYEADRIARQAKREADYEYFQATGADYDPDHRPSGGKARDEWDYCTKIHNIFD